MTKYSLVWAETAIQVIEKLEKNDRRRIVDKIGSILQDPFRFVKRLTGIPLYSLRVGMFRVIMSIERVNLVIHIVDVGKRGNVYGSL